MGKLLDLVKKGAGSGKSIPTVIKESKGSSSSKSSSSSSSSSGKSNAASIEEKVSKGASPIVALIETVKEKSSESTSSKSSGSSSSSGDYGGGTSTVTEPPKETPSVVPEPAPAPKVIQTLEINGRKFDIVEESDVAYGTTHYTAVYENGKRVYAGSGVGTDFWINELQSDYGGIKKASNTVQPNWDNANAVLNTTKSPEYKTKEEAVADLVGPVTVDKSKLMSENVSVGTQVTATPEQLGAVPSVSGNESERQKIFQEKTKKFVSSQEDNALKMQLEKKYYVGKSDKGPVYIEKSPYQILHDYNPFKEDISQQQLYSKLEQDFGNNLDITKKNIQVSTEAGSSITSAEKSIEELTIAIEDVRKAGIKDEIFLNNNGFDTKYTKEEALVVLGDALEQNRDYLAWARETSSKLPDFQSAENELSNQMAMINKYKELGYKINVTDEGYSFELPTSTEVYIWKHGDMTGVALSSASFLESPLAVKTIGSAIQSGITGDKKVNETRLEELSSYALGLDVAIDRGNYAKEVIASPAMVEGVYLPAATLGATVVASEGISIAAPRISAGLEGIGSNLTPKGQAILGELKNVGKTVAEPFVETGKKVVEFGGTKIGSQSLNVVAFGALEGPGLVKVAAESPERLGGVLAESAFEWELVTGAMGEGMKNVDIKAPEWKSSPTINEFKEGAELRNWALKSKIKNITTPIKETIGDIKFEIKQDLKIPEIKAGLSEAKASIRATAYEELPIQEIKTGVTNAGEKLGEFGEKISGKLEAPIANIKEAGSNLKQGLTDAFYDNVPGANKLYLLREESKFNKLEVPSDYTPIGKTEQSTLKGFGKKTKVVQKPSGKFDMVETKEVIKYPAEGSNLEGTRPFGEKIEFKPNTAMEKPNRLSYEPSDAKVESWRDLERLTTKEKPVVKQDTLYPVSEREVLRMDVDVGAGTANLKTSTIKTKFKTPENKPMTSEEIYTKTSMDAKAEFLKRGKMPKTKQKAFKTEDIFENRSLLLTRNEKGELDIIKLEKGKAEFKGGKDKYKFTRDMTKDEKVSFEKQSDRLSTVLERPKVETKDFSIVEKVPKVEFDTSYMYTFVPAKFIVDIDSGIDNSSMYWDERKPKIISPISKPTFSVPRIGSSTSNELEPTSDVINGVVGVTIEGTTNDTRLEERQDLGFESVLEQQTRQLQKQRLDRILDISPSTGMVPGKPKVPILFKRRKKLIEDEEFELLGKKKKKKKSFSRGYRKKDILADIVSVTRSQARHGKATHQKYSKELYEEAARTGFRHVPTVELQTKQFTPRVKNNSLKLDSNKLKVGNNKISVRRGKRNVLKRKKWI